MIFVSSDNIDDRRDDDGGGFGGGGGGGFGIPMGGGGGLGIGTILVLGLDRMGALASIRAS